MRTEYVLFVYHASSTLAKLSTWYFENSCDITCSILVNASYTDECWEGRSMWLPIYTLNLFNEDSKEN